MKLDLHTGTPFWRLRDGLIATYPKLRDDIQTDLLVVGAGITGAVIAHEMSRAGASVVVLDRRDVASGSSAASTGLLLYDTDTSLMELSAHIGEEPAARVYQLGVDAIDYLERFCHDASHDCGFSRRPSFYLASKRSHVLTLQDEHRRRVAHGFKADWLTRVALRERFDLAAPAAIRVDGTAEVDCYRLTHELLRSAASHGAKIFDRTTVAFPSGRDRPIVVTTSDGHHISASHVVWATGYEGSELAGDHAKLASTWVFASEPLESFEGWPDRCLIWETARPYLYVRSTEDGRMIVGGEDEPCVECHRSRWWWHRKIARLAARAQTLFPKIPIDVAYAWAGTFSLTDDGLPIVEQLEGHPGVWVALGYGGNGITFAVMAARIIHDGLMQRPNADARFFTRARGVAAHL